MIKRTDGEVQAYIDGYNACFEKFRETLLQKNVGADKAIRKMETLKEAVNSVLLTENVGMCQQNVGEMSEKQTDGDLISRTKLLEEGAYYSNRPTHTFLKDVVKALPSAEKTAEWKEYNDCIQCPNCGTFYPKIRIDLKHYCERCGAKMKGSEEEE